MDIMKERKKKTVLLISPHSDVKLTGQPSYGFEKRISYIGKAISERYKLIIICPNEVICEKNNQKISFKSFSFFKIKNMRLGSFFLDFNPFYIFKLLKIIKKESPSAIIISFPWGIIITSLLIKIFFKSNIPLIYNSHNVESEYFKITLNDERLPKVLKIFYYYILSIEKLALNLADHVFAVSKENRRYFIEKYKCRPEKISVIHSGAEMPHTISDDPSLKKTEREIYAVFHGTYNSTHNKEAIDIIQYYLADKFKKYKNLKFVIAGKGVPKSKKQNVISVGFVNDLFSFLSICDIAIIPLKHGEGTKLKIFDYMAMGLPIVTTKKGAEGLDLVNGEHAIITDDINEKFIKAIEFLAKNPEIRKKMGQNAKKFFEERYHPEKIKEKILSILDKIIKNNCKG